MLGALVAVRRPPAWRSVMKSPIDKIYFPMAVCVPKT